MFCSKYGTFKHTNSTTNYLFHLSDPVMYLEGPCENTPEKISKPEVNGKLARECLHLAPKFAQDGQPENTMSLAVSVRQVQA